MPTSNRWTTATLALVLAAWAGPAAAQDMRIDPASGASREVFPPDTAFDHQHMRLELEIERMAEPSLRGRQTLRLAARGRARERVRLDAGPDLRIARVEHGGRQLGFVHERAAHELWIDLEGPAQVGEAIELVLEYTLDFGRNRPRLFSTGLVWSAGSPGSGDPNRQRPQIHTQGQPEFNHLWFPCHDFPNERLSTELIVTTEAGYGVLSNGRLVEQTELEGGMQRVHWLQEAPHPAYLVTLVIGDFEVVDLDEDGRAPVPVRLWAPVGKAERASLVFAPTVDMLLFFQEVFDEPYPWDKYDQILPRDYTSGAMENTSASTFYASAADARAGSQDDIIAHELAHQWLGNLVTCRSWEHTWLNEGFASFCEALWAEEVARRRGGEAAARQAYLEKMRRNLAQQGGNRSAAPGFPALASRLYDQPFENFAKPDNPYPKGALVLHMLRSGLGDEVFFEGVRRYIDRHRFGEAETDDLRRVMEEVSGKNLERFFEQWVYQPGLARLTVEASYDDGALDVRVTQTQQIDPSNPAREFFLPIYAEGPGGGRYLYVDVRGRESRQRFEMQERPAALMVDPNVRVAAVTTLRGEFARGSR